MLPYLQDSATGICAELHKYIFDSSSYFITIHLKNSVGSERCLFHSNFGKILYAFLIFAMSSTSLNHLIRPLFGHHNNIL
jgi:hypothetical protein